MNKISPQIERLTLLGKEIEQLDENIKKIGLVYPQVKPLSDIFSKRKENFCGEDIQLLAIETRKFYQTLSWESSRLAFILKYLVGKMSLKEDAPQQTMLVEQF